jgi:hypothetical protein
VSDVNSEPRPRTLSKKIANAVVILSVTLVALYFVASWIWKFSGSNRWELVGERRGVKVYSLKSPGADLTQVKGVVRVRSSMATLVKLMQDPNLCKDLGCKDSIVIKRVDDQLQYISFRYILPFPFHARDFVVRTEAYQNPHTKEVLLEFAAAPDKAPPNDCCFRVTDMNNTWRFTPVEKGLVEVEYIQNMNEGGFIPSLVLNRMRPKILFAILPRLQRFADREQYRNASFDFIKE